MTINELYEDWEDISYSKKIKVLRAIVDYLEKNEDDYMIHQMMQGPWDAEDDDYFGTEGLRG